MKRNKETLGITDFGILILAFVSALATFKMPFPEPWASLRLGTILLLVLTTMWLSKVIISRHVRIKTCGVIYILIGLMIVSIVSLLFNLAIGSNIPIEFGIGQILLVGFPILTLLVIMNNLNTIKIAKATFYAALFSSLIVSLVGIVNLILEWGKIWISNRLESTLKYGPLGVYLMFFFSLILAQMVYEISFLRRMFYLAVFLIIGFALYASFIRAAWVGTAVSILLILILRYRHSIPLKTMISGLIIVILITITSSFWFPLVERTLQIFDPTKEQYYIFSRIPGWLEGLHVFLSHFLLGAGPGSLPEAVINPEVVFNPVLGIVVPVIHNNYIEIAMSTGIMGLIFLIWLLIVIWRKAFRIFKVAQDRFLKGLALGFLGGFTGLSFAMMTGDYLIHSVWNAGFYAFSGSIYIWLMFALMIIISSMERDKA